MINDNLAVAGFPGLVQAGKHRPGKPAGALPDLTWIKAAKPAGLDTGACKMGVIAMFKIFSSRTRYCPQVEAEVNTDQTAEECRSAHGCTQPACPLCGAFTGLADLNLTMAEYRGARN